MPLELRQLDLALMLVVAKPGHDGGNEVCCMQHTHFSVRSSQHNTQSPVFSVFNDNEHFVKLDMKPRSIVNLVLPGIGCGPGKMAYSSL